MKKERKLLFIYILIYHNFSKIEDCYLHLYVTKLKIPNKQKLLSYTKWII